MKLFLFALIVVLGLCIGFFYYTSEFPLDVVPTSDTTTNSQTETDVSSSDSSQTSAPTQIAEFINIEYGFGLKLRMKPYGYSTFENSPEQNGEQGTLFGVTLVRSSDYNQSVAAAAAGNAHDGPPAITVSVFEVDAGTTINQWLLSNRQVTNCEESSILSTVLDDKDASSCLWDGLYLGVTIGIIHNNRVYLLTGTRENEETADGYSYGKDFNEVVSSFEF